MWDLIIKNGIVVNPYGCVRTDVAIKNGKIKAIGDFEANNAEKLIDAEGMYVMPGMIDSHAHIQTGTGEMKSGDDYFTGSLAAAYGGTTSFVDFGFINNGETPRTAIERKLSEAEGKSILDYSFHPCINKYDSNFLNDIKYFLKNGFPSIKLFTVYRDTLMLEKRGVCEVLKMVAEEGGIALVHAESADIIERNIKDAIENGTTGVKYHVASRPVYSETEAMYGVYALAKEFGTSIIFAHMTTGKIKELFETNKKVRLFGEVCPHYLALDASVYDKEDGYNYVCSPPIRESEDRDSLWEMVQKGYIHLINSDHTDYSSRQKVKYKDYFPSIPNGLPTIETRGSVFFSEGVIKRGITLDKFVRLTSTNAAKLMGIYPQKGIIRPGSDADIVIIDPKKEYIMSSKDMHMATDFCPYEGMKMTGRVEYTIVGGDVVIENGKAANCNHRGRLMKRSSPITDL